MTLPVCLARALRTPYVRPRAEKPPPARAMSRAICSLDENRAPPSKSESDSMCPAFYTFTEHPHTRYMRSPAEMRTLESTAAVKIRRALS